MNIYDLRRIVKERLYARQLQAARYGISADPSITIESKELSDLIRYIEKAIVIHNEHGYTEQLEMTTIKTAKSLGIYIDKLEYDHA